MSGEPQQTNEFHDAEEAYASYLERQRENEHLTFEAFCGRHPDLADDLRKLDAGYRLGRAAALSRSFHESIREHFGDVPEVTVLISADGSAEVTADSSAGSAEPSPKPAIPEARGAFGRYDITAEIARGGMGVIYQIRDHDLSRTLAMKVMLSAPLGTGRSGAASTKLARFVEEAQVTAQLDHPGIVPVHELGFDRQGRVYFTMKLVKGRQLGDVFALARAEKDGWNLPRAIGVVVKACQALAYAHAKNVVHRDLKPANIMAGRFGEVYVMDWGLAKVAGKQDLHDIRLQNTTAMTYTSIRSQRRPEAESSTESPLITMDGSVVGTPAYMPPEQASGRVEEVDSSSDVYSLGAILYNLLTGHAPYVEPAARISPHTILARVLDGPPRRIHDVNPDASPELVAICEKAMARDKKRRYRSSLDMAEDLQAYLDRRVVRAYRTGAVAEFRSWVARNRGTAAAAAAALVLTACGLLAVAWVQVQAKREIAAERDIAVTARANEAMERARAEREKARSDELLVEVTAERDLKNEALEQKTAALEEKDRALTRAEGLFLTGIASQEVATNPGRALLLAVEGVERQRETNALANQILLDALRADRELRVLAGSGQPVADVVYSPGGQLIAAVQGGAVRLWDASSGAPVSLILDPGGSPLAKCRFSPDGRLLVATAVTRPRALLFDAPRGTLRAVLGGYGTGSLNEIRCVAFSPDGTRVATASRDGTARIYEAPGGDLISVLRGHECSILSLTFTADSKRILTASEGVVFEFIANGYRSYTKQSGTTARLWDAASGEEVFRIGGHEGAVRFASFSPDGGRILTCSGAGFRLNDATSGADLPAPDLRGWVADAAWTRDGDIIWVGPDGFLRRSRVSPATEVWSSPVAYASSGEPRMGVSPDGRFLALLESQTTPALRDAGSGRVLKTFRGHGASVTSFSFSPDSARLVTGSDDGTLRVWDTGTVQFAAVEPARRYREVRKTVFSPGGERILVMEAAPGDIRVLERSSGREVSRLKRRRSSGLRLLQRERLAAAFFQPGTRDVVTVAENGTLRFWGEAAAPARDPLVAPVFAADLDLDPSGRYIAVLGRAGAVHLLRHGTGEILKRLWEQDVHFAAPRFSPDGKTLLAIGSDHSVRLWAVPSGEEARRVDLQGILPEGAGDRFAMDVVFHPEATRWLLSVERRLVLVDASTGAKTGELDPFWDGVAEHVEFSPDGERILVAVSGRLVIVPGDLAGQPRGVGESSTVHGATFSPGGDRIVAVVNAGDVEVRDARSLEVVYTLGEPRRHVQSVALSTDGRLLLTGATDGTIDLWELEGGRHVRTFGGAAPVELVSLSPDGGTLLGLGDGAACEWETASGRQLRTLTRSEFALRWESENHVILSDAAPDHFSADGRRFSSVYGGSAAVWDVESGELLLDYRGERTSFDASALGSQGERFFLARRDWSWAPLPSVAGAHRRLGGRIPGGPAASRILIFELADGAVAGVLEAVGERPDPRGDAVSASPSDSWRRIAPAPGGRLLAAVSWNLVAVWDVASRTEIFRSRIGGPLLRWSPDGRHLVYRSGRSVQRWDSETAEFEDIRPTHSDTSAMAFSPDGRWMVFLGPGSAAELWSGQAVPLKGHQGPVTDGLFSPDGAWVATASADRTVRVWSAATGAPWVVLPHADEITSLLYSPDGQEILTVTAGRIPHAWPTDLLAAAKARAAGSLTAEERGLFGIGSARERAGLRRREETRKILGELRLLAGVLDRDTYSQSARRECSRLVQELRTVLLDLGDEAADYAGELERTLGLLGEYAVDSPEVTALGADLAESRGDLTGVIEILERAARRGSRSPELEARLEAWRRRALPDLVTFASIDAALESRDTVVPEGAAWRYARGTREPSDGLEWTEAAFDDASWESGPSGFGYGDGDDATLLSDMRRSYSTIYIRHAFPRPDTTRLDDFGLEIRADDGFVAYLNGVELGRSRAGPAGTRATHDALATGESPEPLEPVVLRIPEGRFTAGRNVLALQGMNRSLDSSDLTLIPVLTARRKPDLARDRARFDAFRAAAQEDGAQHRIAYLEARLLERAGKLAQAAARFETIARAIPERAEPVRGLVRCLRALGRFDEALSAATSGLSAGRFQDEDLWDAWFEIALVDLRQAPEAGLAFLERQDLDDAPGAWRGRELRWALRGVRSGALRLNCGGDVHTSAAGVVWERDRFFTRSGRTSGPQPGPIEGAEDVELYRTERHFPPSSSGPPGYRIPLPPGRYRITLGFIEAYLAPPRLRRFDVFLEGEKVLAGFQPKWAQAETRSFERAVLDGFLDLTFAHELDNPNVSAIEVARVD